jgi:hypothetical protein
MQNIKDFKLATPTPQLLEKYGGQEFTLVEFLQSSDGQDWYECQRLFSDDTIKIMYDAQGIIRSLVAEPVPQRGNVLPVSMFWPVDCSVAEVSAIPDGCDISGAWRYTDSGEIVRYHEFDVRQAQRELLRRQSEANSIILPLERAVKYGLASDEEKARLEAWERYSVALSRMDTSKAWPEKPVN